MYKKVYGFYQKQSTLVVLNIKGGNEMGILTFKGGVHPYDGKELSKNSPVVKYLPKGDMVYPLSQHIGAPAAAIVQKGDHVLAGQKIADAAGFVSSPIHSSVSGTVKGIEPRLTATGSMVNSIIIENDQQYESVEFTPARLEDLSKEEILVRIKEGGVVGMGGAGFPTQVKLAPKEPEKIDHILAVILFFCIKCSADSRRNFSHLKFSNFPITFYYLKHKSFFLPCFARSYFLLIDYIVAKVTGSVNRKNHHILCDHTFHTLYDGSVFLYLQAFRCFSKPGNLFFYTNVTCPVIQDSQNYSAPVTISPGA